MFNKLKIQKNFVKKQKNLLAFLYKTCSEPDQTLTFAAKLRRTNGGAFLVL